MEGRVKAGLPLLRAEGQARHVAHIRSAAHMMSGADIGTPPQPESCSRPDCEEAPTWIISMLS